MKMILLIEGFFFVGVMTLLSSCSKSNRMVQDPAIWRDTAQFTEVLIEYPGPEESWGGPQDFVFHIVAKEGESAQFATKPAQFLKTTKSGNTFPMKGIAIQATRQDLEKLNRALKENEPEFKGCLTPIRIKLMREDGVVIERQSCRGPVGWPKVASEIVSKYVEHSLQLEKMSPSVQEPSLEVSPNIMR